MVPTRQNALKQRLTNILAPTMKTKPWKRPNASRVVLVTAFYLTLAKLGWRTPTIAYEVSDPDLQEKLDAEALDAVELKSASVKDAIEKFSGLDGAGLIRFYGTELPSYPFFDSAVKDYVRAEAELEGLQAFLV